MKCYHCGESHENLKTCPNCHKEYCTYHINPIDHNCDFVIHNENIELYQGDFHINQYEGDSDIRVISSQNYLQSEKFEPIYDETYTWYREETSIPQNAFSPDSGINFKGILLPYKSESIHFIVGALLIYIIGFITFFDTNLIQLGYGWSIFLLSGFYAIAFLFHELGHRQVAKHYGMQTKFRLLTLGMVLTIFSLITGTLTLFFNTIPIPTLALPGAVVVLGMDKVDRKSGVCKVAGPFVNLILGAILLIISFLVPIAPLNLFLGVAASLNYTLGLFNMIPIGILDGKTILKWNKKVYLLIFGALTILIVITNINVYFPALSLYYL